MATNLPDINKFLQDESKDNLVVYEVKNNFFIRLIYF